MSLLNFKYELIFYICMGVKTTKCTPILKFRIINELDSHRHELNITINNCISTTYISDKQKGFLINLHIELILSL